MAEAPQIPPRRVRRFWLTIGEVAAVLAVAIAGLNYWDSQREHKARAAQAAAQSALILTGFTQANGEKLVLRALEPGQAIQSQRYLFPTAVLAHPMEVVAAAPQINGAWIEPGLGRALEARHVRGDGEARLPVGVITTYVEDGQTRTDRSLYRIGYAWRARFVLRRRIVLQGIALDQRAVGGDLQALVNQRWTQASGGGPT